MLLKGSKAEMDLLQRKPLILPPFYTNCYYRTQERQGKSKPQEGILYRPSCTPCHDSLTSLYLWKEKVRNPKARRHHCQHHGWSRLSGTIVWTLRWGEQVWYCIRLVFSLHLKKVANLEQFLIRLTRCTRWMNAPDSIVRELSELMYFIIPAVIGSQKLGSVYVDELNT